MKITIDDKYFVEIDENSFNLHYVTPQKKDVTKTTDRILGFYSGVERAIRGCIQHKLSKEDSTVGLDEFMAKWKAYNDSISGIFAKHNMP